MGASLNFINCEIKYLRKLRLRRPISYSTLPDKDTINYEVHTEAPAEFSIQNNARVRIGIYIFKILNAQINIETKEITCNGNVCNFYKQPL